MMEKLVYSVDEVSQLLGISRSYAYELVKRKVIPVLELGNRRVIPKKKFEDWINDKGEPQ